MTEQPKPPSILGFEVVEDDRIPDDTVLLAGSRVVDGRVVIDAASITGVGERVEVTEDMARLVEQSSLGTDAARKLRARTDDQTRARIRQAAREVPEDTP